MHDYDFALDYSLESINDSLDKILDLPLWRSQAVVMARINDDDVAFDLESAAAAYLGEVLARRFNGMWAGHFSSKSGVNFYTLRMMFGDYCLHPVHWLSYRVANGRDEGSLAQWLERVTPSMKARRDLTPKTGIITDIY